ncbi:MAG: hypothetical protein HWD86_04900 [Kangiellaceae bacterium]|nr:hypothetical protein [Kangiellaceae bacterium]
MKKLVTILSIAVISSAFALGVPTASVQADEVKVPVSQQGSNISTPKRGISKAQVEKRFGSPSSVQGPVGQPPITKWVYGSFTVYFEYDHVIHAVAHKS